MARTTIRPLLLACAVLLASALAVYAGSVFSEANALPADEAWRFRVRR